MRKKKNQDFFYSENDSAFEEIFNSSHKSLFLKEQSTFKYDSF